MDLFFILNNILLTFVRNDGNPKLSMVAMLVGSFSNIVLDYIFMFPLEMGMFGAAFATALAPIISIIVLSGHFIKKKITIAIFRNKMVWAFIPDMSGLGASAFTIEISSAVVLITFNLVILGLEGNIGVAAYGIVANLALVGIAVFTGLSQGMQPLSSRYYGLKDYGSVSKILRYALLTSVAIAAVLYFGTVAFVDQIVAIFNSDNILVVAQMARTGIRIYFIGFFFVSVNIVSVIFLSATENPRAAFILSIARGIVLIIPLVLVLSRIWGMTGVWFSFVLAELIVTIPAIYAARLTIREKVMLQ